MAELLTQSDARDIALADAAARFGPDPSVDSIESVEFPTSTLGASRHGELSAAIVTPGWRLSVTAGGRSVEYRANHRQVRLVGVDGENLLVFPR